MMGALYILCGMPEGTCQAEVTSSSDKINLIVIELCLSEGISKQSVSRKFEAFRVILNALLGLLYLTNTAKGLGMRLICSKN